MARIPDQELERIKREISTAELARSLGIELKAHGANLIGLCVLHPDRNPSFVVSESNNLWHCLGACQAGGSNIDLLMRAKKLSFREAALWLREQLAPLAAASATTEPPALSSLATAADDRTLLREVVRFYHRTLEESPEALAYLESRGLRCAEMVERFQLGFANRTLGYRLPHMRLRAGAEIRTRLQRLGILRESGHEHLSGSLVIPILDEHGEVSEIYGRKITPRLRPGTPLHLYLPAGAGRVGSRETGVGSGRGVWNIEALKAAKEVILCEALIDALTFWCAGFRNGHRLLSHRVSARHGRQRLDPTEKVRFRRRGALSQGNFW
jgi:DNA primase